MTSKKPSLKTLLKNANVELVAQRQENTKLAKEIETKNNSIRYSDDRTKAAENELAQVHAFLDAVPNPPASKGEDGYSKIGAMTRLAVYLAGRGSQAAP